MLNATNPNQVIKGHNISLIGGGNMAESLIGGLIAGGIEPESISVGEPDRERRDVLKTKFSITVHSDNETACNKATIIILAVKPQLLQAATESINNVLLRNTPLLISIAAGIRISSIEAWSNGEIPIVRAMPNTPALINAGITTLVANNLVLPDQRDQAQIIMHSVGNVVWIEDELFMDAVTAISGSGPAYFFYFLEALEAAAIDEGLDEGIARLLTLETALGASRLAIEASESLIELRKKVTSPGGTTEAAIAVLEDEGMRSILSRTVKAACKRSSDLAEVFGKS